MLAPTASNNISGSLPVWFREWRNATRIYVHDNSLTGTVMRCLQHAVLSSQCMRHACRTAEPSCSHRWLRRDPAEGLGEHGQAAAARVLQQPHNRRGC